MNSILMIFSFRIVEPCKVVTYNNFARLHYPKRKKSQGCYSLAMTSAGRGSGDTWTDRQYGTARHSIPGLAYRVHRCRNMQESLQCLLLILCQKVIVYCMTMKTNIEIC